MFSPALTSRMKWLSICTLGYIMYGLLAYIIAASLFHNDFSILSRTIRIGFDSGNFYITGFNLNTPFVNLVLSPLAHKLWPRSFIIWEFVSIGLLMLSIHLITRILPLKNPLLFFSAALFSVPTFVNMVLGQLTAPCLLLFTILWLDSRAGKNIRPGILLGLLLSIKLFFGLFIFFFLAQRRWKLFAAAGLTFSIINFCIVVYYGIEPYFLYHKALSSVLWFGHAWNASLEGCLSRLFGLSKWPIYGLWHFPVIKQILYGILSISILSYLIKKSLKIKNISEFDFTFSLFSCGMLFISPLGWVYYFPFLYIAYATLLYYAPRFRHKEIILLLTSLSWLAMNAPVVAAGSFTSAFISAGFSFKYFIYMFSLVLLFFTLVLAREESLQKKEIAIFNTWPYLILPVIAFLCFLFIYSFYVNKLFERLTGFIN